MTGIFTLQAIYPEFTLASEPKPTASKSAQKKKKPKNARQSGKDKEEKVDIVDAATSPSEEEKKAPEVPDILVDEETAQHFNDARNRDSFRRELLKGTQKFNETTSGPKQVLSAAESICDGFISSFRNLISLLKGKKLSKSGAIVDEYFGEIMFRYSQLLSIFHNSVAGKRALSGSFLYFSSIRDLKILKEKS